MTAYLLIKIVPFWGLSLIATTLLYIVPFVYINNKEVIDTQINNASHVVNKQTAQIKDVAGHHTARASESVKNIAGDYSAKAQEYMGSARQTTANAANKATAATTGRSTSGTTTTKPTAAGSRNTSSAYKTSDFPNAPQTGPTPATEQFKATADELSREAGVGNVKKQEGPVLAS